MHVHISVFIYICFLQIAISILPFDFKMLFSVFCVQISQVVWFIGSCLKESKTVICILPIE